MVTGDSHEEVIIFRDRQTDRHFIIIYISPSSISSHHLNKVAMLREVDQLDLVMDKLDHIVADPFNKLNSSDEILSFVKVKWTSEKVFSLPLTQYWNRALPNFTTEQRYNPHFDFKDSEEVFNFASPRSSPRSSISSRSSSLRSVRTS